MREICELDSDGDICEVILAAIVCRHNWRICHFQRIGIFWLKLVYSVQEIYEKKNEL